MGEEEVLEFQVQSLEGTIKQLPDSIAKASECSSRVTKRFEELKQYYDKCRAPLTNCVSIQERFQDIEKAIESVMFNMNEEESQKREDFLSEHGRYLPTSLFPSALRETAVHYRISGDIQPISLPGLSRKYTRD